MGHLCHGLPSCQFSACYVFPSQLKVRHGDNLWGWVHNKNEMKKRSEETQTLCAGCSKVEPKLFAPPQTPFPGMWDSQNLISWRWLSSPTNTVWRGSMHAISSYRGNRLTHPHTHKQTGPRSVTTSSTIIPFMLLRIYQLQLTD